jgi:hypothetical protein
VLLEVPVNLVFCGGYHFSRKREVGDTIPSNVSLQEYSTNELGARREYSVDIGTPVCTLASFGWGILSLFTFTIKY